MATLDVKNANGLDTGPSKNGKTVINTARIGNNLGQFLKSPGYSEFAVAGFDTSPPGCILKDRIDDPRYYSGDTAS